MAYEQKLWSYCEMISMAYEQKLWSYCEMISMTYEQKIWSYCEMISMTYEQQNMSHVVVVVVEGKVLGVLNGNYNLIKMMMLFMVLQKSPLLNPKPKQRNINNFVTIFLKRQH
jgi:hypothetical protein